MILSLETLRGLAALIVAFYHFPGESIFFVKEGFMAVYFFFSLSGFVIALNYFSKINMIELFELFWSSPIELRVILSSALIFSFYALTKL